MKNILKIGTRGSKLALAQANLVKKLLAEKSNIDSEIVIITTSGDKIQDKSLIELGGKGLFTKEIEDKLLNHEIDLAVHSMKDVPTLMPEGLKISCILPREEPWDAFISYKAKTLWDLPEGATIGTSGVRRKALCLAVRPDLKIEIFRGNVDTRLKKLKAGIVDATFLAVAGLKRLGLEDVITCKLTADEMLPSAGQGAIGIEVRIEDEDVKSTLIDLNCQNTATCVTAERAFIDILDGSCRTPIAAYAYFDDNKKMHIRGLIAEENGSDIWSEDSIQEINNIEDAIKLGRLLAESIKMRVPAYKMEEII